MTNAYMDMRLNVELLESNKKRMADVVECLITKDEGVDDVKFGRLILSFMISLKLATFEKEVPDKDEMKNYDTQEATDEIYEIKIHNTLIKSFKLTFTKRNIIPYLVRFNMLLVKSMKHFQTILEIFKLIDKENDRTFISYEMMVKRDRENYLKYIENVVKGGKVLSGAVTLDTIATSTADEADLSVFIDDWTTGERAKLGVYLINNGNKMRQNKGTFEISIEDETFKGVKTVLIKFPRESEEIASYDLTYPRAAIITARDVATKCCKLDSNNGIKMSALALNIGWHGLFAPENILRLTDVFLKCKLQAVTADMLFLCTIPRIRPHKYLNLQGSECYLMTIFYIINDVIISLKTGKDRFDFTADTMSKLKKINQKIDDKCLKKTFAAVWNITRHHMSHKVQISKEVAVFVKKVLVAEREGKFSEIKTEERILNMLDNMTLEVTDKEILEWSSKTRSENR